MLVALFILALESGPVGLSSSGPSTAASLTPSGVPEPASARSWIGREAEIEAALKHAEVVKLEPIGTGVTKPYRADVAAGGAIEAFAWKPITAGRYHGFYESYKSEVAAYEMDRLLGLGMVPVKVERQVDGQYGAACLWVSPAITFKQLGGPPTPPAEESRRWYLQLTRAKMFDNLINNLDPNLGNWMVDPAWNLILIDHSRAFSRGRRMVHELRRVDRELWKRMLALDEETLTRPLGQWLGRAQIRSILRRRDRMAKVVAELIEEHGEEAVLVGGQSAPSSSNAPSDNALPGPGWLTKLESGIKPSSGASLVAPYQFRNPALLEL